MINPITFLWRQFNGPQIKAFCQGIWLYFKETYDWNMEYWRRLSIATANEDHITTIGALHGLARPLINIQADDFALFTTVPPEGTYYPSIPYRESPHGLSAVNNMSYGGRFSEVGDISTFNIQKLDIAMFRTILKASVKSQAKLGSLAYLDDILWGIWCAQQGTEEVAAPYTFKILQEEDLEQYYNRACGDIVVNIGRDVYWGEYNQILAEFNLLGRTVYYPTPTLYAIADA